MVKFCPTCGNMLLVEHSDAAGLRFFCQACPYVQNIYNQTGDIQRLNTAKKIDPVIGADDWKAHASQTDATCPACHHDKAFYMEIQIRSADEPATRMYKCAECDHRWDENS